MDTALNWLWQGGVVAVATFVMLRVLDRARANVRYVVCWAALLLVAALPVLPSFQSAPPSDAFVSTSAAAMVSLPDSWWTSALVMLAAWMIWATVCAVRFIPAMLALRRARARSRAFPSHVEAALPSWSRVRCEGRRASLVLSDSIATAAVLPWGAPMIAVAPSLMSTLDSAELDRVLIHEWAHVQRRDDVVNILQIIVRAIAGWHPAFWWIERRLHVEREIACDEMTVAVTGSPKSYAACLMKLASLRGAARAMQGAPAIFAMSGLHARVTKIVTPSTSIAPFWSRTLATAIVSTLCVMSVGVAGMELVEAIPFALPVMPTRMLDITLEKFAPAALPTAPSQVANTRSPRRTVPPAPSPTPETTQQASSSPAEEPKADAPVAPEPANPVESTPTAAEAHADGAARADATNAVHTPAPQATDAIAEQPRSPWSAAADGGVALGRTSKQAGVATAGLFSRFARRVAGSF